MRKRDVEYVAHAGAVHIQAAFEREQHPERAESEHDDGGDASVLRAKNEQPREAQSEFNVRVDIGVGTERFGEQIVHLKAISEFGWIKEFESREKDEREAHERVHPQRDIAHTRHGRGEDCRDGDKNDQWPILNHMAFNMLFKRMFQGGAILATRKTVEVKPYSFRQYYLRNRNRG